MTWTVTYRRGGDGELVSGEAVSEAAARNTFAALTEYPHSDEPIWVELQRGDVMVERWA